jgi:hypothetical protein
MVSVIPDDILSIVALVSVTMFMWIGHAKKILLLSLFALIMVIIIAAWSFGLIVWFIPFLFLIANLIIFVLDAAGK